MGRFTVLPWDDAKGYEDPDGLTDFGHDLDYSSYLIDTETGEVVFCDASEPEDATLGRTYRPLVDLLNKVAAE